MTEMMTNFRLGIKYKEFRIDFLCVEVKGKAILGAGMRHSFCRGPLG